VSELNRIAQEYLESLGVEVPAVVDASPKTFDTQPRGGFIRSPFDPLVAEDARRNKAVPAVTPASAEMIKAHIYDVWRERTTAEEYKDAREMWDAINFQPLPIAAEEVEAPPAWRTWPTGNEVRAAVLIGIFVLSVIVFFVTRNS
jgi:hypothetical protein